MSYYDTTALPSAVLDEVSALKRASPALLLLTGTVGYDWTAIGGDAVEIGFCTGLPMAFRPKHISDAGTRLTLPEQGLTEWIDRLIACGNPVALVDTVDETIRTYWPAPVAVTPDQADERDQVVLTGENAGGSAVEWLDTSAYGTLAGFALHSDVEVPF